MKTQNSDSQNLMLIKMQGAGNSFLIICDSEDLNFNRAKAAAKLCDSHFGIGADGLVFLSINGNQVQWDFYNSDGSNAEFCGNAARCVALLASEISKQNKISIQTRAGQVDCVIKNNQTVEVRMPEVKWIDKGITVPLWPQPVPWVNTGVPHLVLEVPHIDDLKKYKTEAAKIRSWEGLGPQGANVTFYFIHANNVISAVTFERGVEDFTLACGTGAVAAAVVNMERFNQDSCQVQMPGGKMEVSEKGGHFYMAGEAKKIAEIIIQKEELI